MGPDPGKASTIASTVTRPGPRRLLVTGAYRSGTTLVEKVLHNATNVACFSQPLPLLYVEVKRVFLSTLGYEGDPYPLSSLFGETRYGRQDLRSFLDRFRVSASIADLVARSQDGYSGALSPEASDLLAGFAGQDLATTIFDVCSAMRGSLGNPAADTVGCKEILVEEFAPYLADSGFHVVFVVRDPRSVIASLDFGRGTEFGGAHRPTIFHLHNWRKSVAFALGLSHHANVTVVRYEDMIGGVGLTRLADELGLVAGQLRTEGLLDQYGNPWQSNSSFDTPAPPWNEMLSPAEARYIEMLCLPEMLALGYETDAEGVEATVIEGHVDRFSHDRPEIPDGFGHRSIDAEREVRRLQMLKSSTRWTGSELEEWFLLESAYEALRDSLWSRS